MALFHKEGREAIGKARRERHEKVGAKTSKETQDKPGIGQKGQNFVSKKKRSKFCENKKCQ